MIQRQQNFVSNRRCDAVVTDNHDRLAVMGQGFEMTFLWVGECLHAGEPDRVKEANNITAGKGMTVAPSPLNEVKLDLGIILTVGGLLLLVQGRIVESLLVQLVVLASYGLLGLCWIVIRTRKIMAGIARNREQRADGPD